METLILKSDSKENIALIAKLAKQLGISVSKEKSSEETKTPNKLTLKSMENTSKKEGLTKTENTSDLMKKLLS